MYVLKIKKEENRRNMYNLKGKDIVEADIVKDGKKVGSIKVSVKRDSCKDSNTASLFHFLLNSMEVFDVFVLNGDGDAQALIE